MLLTLMLAAGAPVAIRNAIILPPMISLDMNGLSDIHSIHSDGKGTPCNSFAADTESCHAVHAGHRNGDKVFYKFCKVGEHNCELPVATAQDHHEGEIEVTTTTFLHVRSDKHAATPKVVDAKVGAIDFDQRGEFYMNYDAMDSSGNAASTVTFHVFVVDTTPPAITITPPTEDGPITVRARAMDAYDGDVSDTVRLKLTTPHGATFHHDNAHGVAKLDVAQPGTWKLTATAHDFAGAFGRDYANNAAKVSGTITIGSDGRLASYDIGAQSRVFPTHSTSAPHAIVAGGAPRSHYIPPVLAISWGGHVVARGSPFGVHHTEAAYRAHLTQRGVAQSTIDDTVSQIVAREERLARANPEMMWHGKKLW